jgi:hypothetical protein
MRWLWSKGSCEEWGNNLRTNDSWRLGNKIYRLLVSVGIVCLAVVGAGVLFGAPPLISIVIGGGVGCVIARFVLYFAALNGRERERNYDQRINGSKWFALWFVALCALHFVVGLALIESVCCVAALASFFILVERYNRARAARRSSLD